MVGHCLDRFLPDLGVLVNSPVTYFIQMDLDSIPQPRLTDLYEYLLNLDNFSTICPRYYSYFYMICKLLFGVYNVSVYYIL